MGNDITQMTDSSAANPPMENIVRVEAIQTRIGLRPNTPQAQELLKTASIRRCSEEHWLSEPPLPGSLILTPPPTSACRDGPYGTWSVQSCSGLCASRCRTGMSCANFCSAARTLAGSDEGNRAQDAERLPPLPYR